MGAFNNSTSLPRKSKYYPVFVGAISRNSSRQPSGYPGFGLMVMAVLWRITRSVGHFVKRLLHAFLGVSGCKRRLDWQLLSGSVPVVCWTASLRYPVLRPRSGSRSRLGFDVYDTDTL